VTLIIKEVVPDYNNYLLFAKVFSNSFGMTYSFERFKWTYMSKISCKSLILFIYRNENLVAVRGLWKIFNLPAYQLIDTCVLPSERGLGVFRFSNEYIRDKYDVYNLPNSQSKPGYLKCGWKVAYEIGVTFLSKRNFECDRYSEEELEWRIINNPSRKYWYKKLDKGFLIVTFKKSIIPVAVGKIDVKPKLKQWRLPVPFMYATNSKFFLKKSGSVLFYGDYEPKKCPIIYDML
jgi:hypothetical protein